MICLIDAKEVPDAGVFTRIRRARGGYRGIQLRYITVLGMRVLYITIDTPPSMTRKTALKRIGCAVEMMRAQRVCNVLFAKNFSYREQILREGFDETDDRLLVETLAGQIASSFSGKDKGAVFFAYRLTGYAEQAFYTICRDFRYVMSAVGTDENGLVAALSKELGISIIDRPSEKQLLKADVAVFYDPPNQEITLGDHCIAIPVSSEALNGVHCRKAIAGVTVAPADGNVPEIPEGFVAGPLYAYAIRAGALRYGDIRLHDINIEERPV